MKTNFGSNHIISKLLGGVLECPAILPDGLRDDCPVAPQPFGDIPECPAIPLDGLRREVLAAPQVRCHVMSCYIVRDAINLLCNRIVYNICYM